MRITLDQARKVIAGPVCECKRFASAIIAIRRRCASEPFDQVRGQLAPARGGEGQAASREGSRIRRRMPSSTGSAHSCSVKAVWIPAFAGMTSNASAPSFPRKPATVGGPAPAVTQGISPLVPATTRSSSLNAVWIPAFAGMTTPRSFPRKRESIVFRTNSRRDLVNRSRMWIRVGARRVGGASAGSRRTGGGSRQRLRCSQCLRSQRPCSTSE